MSALNSSVASAATTVGAKQFQWGLVLVEKTTSGHRYKSGPLIIGAPRGFGDLGRMAIYFQGAGEQSWLLFSGIWGAS